MKVEKGAGEGEHGKGKTRAGEQKRGREGEKGNRGGRKTEEYVTQKKRQSIPPKYTAELHHCNSGTRALHSITPGPLLKMWGRDPWAGKEPVNRSALPRKGGQVGIS